MKARKTKKEPKTIKRIALPAKVYDAIITLSDFCRKRDDCADCPLNISPDIKPLACCMLNQLPEDYTDYFGFFTRGNKNK